MPKASEVASELRKLADSLDREPDAETGRAWLDFFCHANKSQFLTHAKTLPRPCEKIYDRSELKLRYESDALRVDVHVERDTVCRLVEPAREAVYECEPLLSEAEEDAGACDDYYDSCPRPCGICHNCGHDREEHAAMERGFPLTGAGRW